MTKLELFDLMRQIVLACTNVPEAILANQNEQSPDGEYCSIHIDGARRQRGQANITDKDTAPVVSPIGNVLNVEVDVKAQLIAEVTLNFYRGDANIYASQMFQANKKPTISQLLFENKVGWQGSNPVNDLTALQSSKWEPRAQVVIRLMYEQSEMEEVNAIYGVLTQVEDEDGNILVEEFCQAPTEP